MLSRSSICGSSTELAHSCLDNDDEELGVGRGRVSGKLGIAEANATSVGELDANCRVDVAWCELDWSDPAGPRSSGACVDCAGEVALRLLVSAEGGRSDM
jgi:hypothetical protein